MEENMKITIEVPNTAAGKMQLAVQLLKEITVSGYIPFSSPSPSSTEAAIKRDINIAIDNVEAALYKHTKCYGEK